MHTHPPHQRIVSLPICHLHPHPGNAKRVVDSNTVIQKLNALSQNQPFPKIQGKPFLLPMTFFMTESQHALVTAGFDRANHGNTDSGRSQKRLDAPCRMAEDCLLKKRPDHVISKKSGSPNSGSVNAATFNAICVS